MAKFTLWSPFVGFFLFGLLGELVKSGNETTPKQWTALCGAFSLFFAGGITLGIKALRTSKLEGRKGIYGRALTGMVFHGLFLALMICLIGSNIWLLKLQTQQKQQEASDMQKVKKLTDLRDAATTDFGLKVKELLEHYRSSGTALREAEVLNAASVRTQEDLKIREQIVSNFTASSKSLKELLEHGPELYDQELEKRNLPRRFRVTSVKAFTKTFYSNSAPNIWAYRQAEVRCGEAMLKWLNFLDETWGQWEYLSATQQIEFKDHEKLTEYNAVLAELSQASVEKVKLEQKAPQQKSAQ
jgi:hypothetical protein